MSFFLQISLLAASPCYTHLLHNLCLIGLAVSLNILFTSLILVSPAILSELSLKTLLRHICLHKVLYFCHKMMWSVLGLSLVSPWSSKSPFAFLDMPITVAVSVRVINHGDKLSTVIQIPLVAPRRGSWSLTCTRMSRPDRGIRHMTRHVIDMNVYM